MLSIGYRRIWAGFWQEMNAAPRCSIKEWGLRGRVHRFQWTPSGSERVKQFATPSQRHRGAEKAKESRGLRFQTPPDFSQATAGSQAERGLPTPSAFSLIG